MAQYDGIVRSVTFTWMSQVLKADPEFFAKRKDVVLYEMSNGTQKRGDPRKVATAYPDE